MSRNKRTAATLVQTLTEHLEGLRMKHRDLTAEAYQIKKKICEVEKQITDLTSDPEVQELAQENAKVLSEWA